MSHSPHATAHKSQHWLTPGTDVYSHPFGRGRCRSGISYLCMYVHFLLCLFMLVCWVAVWNTGAWWLKGNRPDPLYSELTERGWEVGGEGLWRNPFFPPTSGTDFHSKAALINMALKTGPFYLVHKDHREDFKFLLHTIASDIKIKRPVNRLLLI